MLSIDQTNWMYSNDELGRVYENSLSKDPETGFFVLESGAIVAHCENALFL